jgi:predicted Rossmann fold nucleotide-binding protein DprA/Smf involved in DNA uptake
MEFINDMYDQTDRVVISPIDVGDNDVLADALPVTRKIERELEESPKTVDQLVQSTGSNINTVRTTLSRYSNKFERMERNTYRLNPTYYKGGSNA